MPSNIHKTNRYQQEETTISLDEDVVYLKSDMTPVNGCVYNTYDNGALSYEIKYQEGDVTPKLTIK